MQQLRFFSAVALLYMFRVTILPIIRSTMLYMATGELAHLGYGHIQHCTPENGWDYHPKHVEWSHFGKKTQLLHLVGLILPLWSSGGLVVLSYFDNILFVSVFTLYYSVFVGILLNFGHVIVGLYEFALASCFTAPSGTSKLKKGEL